MIIGYLGIDDKIIDLRGKYVDDFGYYIDEEIIKEYKNVNSAVFPGWGRIANVSEGLENGEGNFILTNKRLIFKREINPRKKLQGGPALFISMIDEHKMKKLKEKGLMEYFELNLKEIHHVKKGWFGGRAMYVLAPNDKKFCIGLPKIKDDDFGDFVDLYLIKKNRG